MFFIKAVNQLLDNKNDTIADLELLKNIAASTETLDKELETVTEEMSVLVEMIHGIVEANASTAFDQKKYEIRYNNLVDRYEGKRARYDELAVTIADKRAQGEIIGNFIKTIRKTDGLVESFDEGLWGGMVEYITVFNKKKVVFIFKGGIEITVEE